MSRPIGLALMVALGGSLGALGRYYLGGWIYARSRGVFPWGTFSVNLLGCLAMGLLAGWLARRFGPTSAASAFVLIGALGSFTTFSTFSLELWRLLVSQHWAAAVLYGLGSPLGGVLGVWLGSRIGG